MRSRVSRSGYAVSLIGIMRRETAKSFQRAWRAALGDWKTALVIALPIFAVAMCFGVSRGYDQIGLFAVAVAIGAWSVGDTAAGLFRKWREHRQNSRGGRDA